MAPYSEIPRLMNGNQYSISWVYQKHSLYVSLVYPVCSTAAKLLHVHRPHTTMSFFRGSLSCRLPIWIQAGLWKWKMLSIFQGTRWLLDSCGKMCCHEFPPCCSHVSAGEWQHHWGDELSKEVLRLRLLDRCQWPNSWRWLPAFNWWRFLLYELEARYVLHQCPCGLVIS